MVLPSLDPLPPGSAPRPARRADGTGSRGRHRRPESLADTQPAPPPVPDRSGLPPRQRAPHDDGSRGVTRRREPGAGAHRAPSHDAHPADDVIRQARHAASRLSHGHEPATPLRATPATSRPAPSPTAAPFLSRLAPFPAAAPLLSRLAPFPAAASTGGRRRAEDVPGHTGSRHARTGRAPADSSSRHAYPGRPRTEIGSRHAESRRRSRRAAAPRGRHSLPPDPLAITVRPLRDAVAVRGLDAPVIGSRRAPGTLPIESWLLVGKGRQQALLAAVVAAGLALVMIPGVQRDAVDPVTAAGTAAVVTPPARKPAADPTTPPPPPPAPQKPTAKPVKPGKPAGTRTTAPPKPAAPAEVATPPVAPVTEPPVVVVPAGDGPFGSWRTTGSGTVALTFDDGPDPVQTPRILAILAEHDVRATFCLVGAQVEKHPEIVQQIVAAGHVLCNHSWDHSLLLGVQSPAVIEADLARTNQAIHRAVPDVAIPFFRAPGGRFTERLVQTAYRTGMTSLSWEVDPRDWEHTAETDSATHVRKIVTEVRRDVQPGAIVLSHDFQQPATITAYGELLPWLTENFELGVPEAPAPPADR